MKLNNCNKFKQLKKGIEIESQNISVMERYESEEDDRSMCFQADEFINMALNSDNLRERVSSKRVSIHDGPRLGG